MTSPGFDLKAAISREELPLHLLHHLFAALHTFRLRGAHDPRSTEAVARLEETLREAGPKSRIQRSGPHLVINRVCIRPTPDIRLQVRTLWSELDRLGIGALEIDGYIERDALLQFLDLYPRLDTALTENGALAESVDAHGKPHPILNSVLELVPGVTAHPYDPQAAEDEGDRRNSARRTFFRALQAARLIFRQSQVHKIPELRKARAVVHEMVDTLVEEEFSLLGLSAMHNFDAYTFQHSVHVAVLSMAVGQRLGLPRAELSQLGVGAMFHDMGKTRIPKRVLWKPGRFDANEWKIMHRHPLSGARELLQYGGMSDLAIRVMLVSAEHHLRFDGSGYPKLGEDWQQGLFSRIVTLCDCFDAMTASRIYMERPFTPDGVIRYMMENSGRMFDPDLLRVFVGLTGLYPVGSMVRLESGELGVVLEPAANPRQVDRPRIRILAPGPDGALSPAEDRSLDDGPEVDPRFRIRAGCHPLDHGISIDEILSRVYLDDDLAQEAA